MTFSRGGSLLREGVQDGASSKERPQEALNGCCEVGTSLLTDGAGSPTACPMKWSCYAKKQNEGQFCEHANA
jgi:hypothetical protein